MSGPSVVVEFNTTTIAATAAASRVDLMPTLWHLCRKQAIKEYMQCTGAINITITFTAIIKVMTASSIGGLLNKSPALMQPIACDAHIAMGP